MGWHDSPTPVADPPLHHLHFRSVVHVTHMTRHMGWCDQWAACQSVWRMTFAHNASQTDWVLPNDGNTASPKSSTKIIHLSKEFIYRNYSSTEEIHLKEILCRHENHAIIPIFIVFPRILYLCIMWILCDARDPGITVYILVFALLDRNGQYINEWLIPTEKMDTTYHKPNYA